jgi:hypothetical protein
MDEIPSKKTIINEMYEGSPNGYYKSKEDVVLGTIRVIDGELHEMRLKHSKRECVWYPFPQEKEG